MALFPLAVQETSPKSANQQPAGELAKLRYPKSARLLKHSDFERVYRQGRRYSLPDMAVFHLPRTESAAGAYSTSSGAAKESQAGVRVGFTVPRALGGAVQRNRIKRRMREAVRLSLPLARDCGSVDVVMNPRRSVAEIEFPKLVNEVQEAFRAIQQRKGSMRPLRSDASRKATTKK